MDFRTTTSLNLRNGAGTDEAILLTLPKGHKVTLLDDLASQPGWWQVATTLRGGEVTGFVSARFLVPLDEAPAPVSSAALSPLPAVHMPNPRRHAIKRTGQSRAYALNESGLPGGPPSAAALWGIVDWLDVEKSAHVRYQPIPGGSTFCNIYAYDLCFLAGPYLPRVWWTRNAIARLRQGVEVPPVYDHSIHELNANALHDWLSEFGPEFGWRAADSLTAAQNAANDGKLATIVATTGTAASGHITILLAEQGGERVARRSGNRVVAPLQSQAGRRNQKFHSNDWWDSSHYQSWGIWIAD